MILHAIGDIHGHREALARGLSRIEASAGRDAPVVILGDLVDRGPDSRGVIELLMEGRARGRDWTVLMGNHDRLFLDFLDTGQIHSPQIKSGRPWLHEALGGLATLASYGIDPDLPPPALFEAAQRAVPADHRAFLAALPRLHRAEGLVFVHAGLRPGVALSAQDPDDLLWIREPFLSHPDPFEALVIHGHTALPAPRHHGNRVNLDGGAGYGRPLTVARIAGRSVVVLGEHGETPLLPGD